MANEKKGLSRRDFLKGAALGAVGMAAMGIVNVPGASAAEAQTAEAASAGVPGYRGELNWLGQPPVIDEADIKETIEADVLIIGAGHAGVQAALAAAEAGVSVSVLDYQGEEMHTVLGEDTGVWNAQWLIDKGFGPYDEGEVINEFVKRSAGRVNPALISSYVKNSGEMFDNTVALVEAAGDPDGIMHYGGGEDGVLIVQVQKDVEQYPIEMGGYKTWATTPQFVGEISHETIPGIAARTNLPKFQGYAIAKSKELGAAWYYGNNAEVLVQDESGAVLGCIAKNAEGEYVKYIGKKGTIVTTGDFATNKEMCWALLGEASEWAERNGKTLEDFGGPFGRNGSGHKMCCWAGGRIEEAPRGTMNNGGGPGGPWGMAPYFWINANGKRFCNEAAVPLTLGTASRQPAGLMAAITDAKWMQTMSIAGLEHGGPNYGRPVYYDEMEDDMAQVVAAGAEGYPVRTCTIIERNTTTVYGAETLDALLDIIGYVGEAKEEALRQIEHYNALCAAGADTDFGKDGKAMIPIDTAPFYAVAKENSFSSDGIGLVTLAGMVTDDDMNVLDASRQPIYGLYVAGNTLGGRYGPGYTTPCAGNSIGMAMTHGRVVGKHVASL